MRILITVTYEEGTGDVRAIWEYIAQVALLQYPEITGVTIEAVED